MREDLIKPTFITATVGYGATVIGIGMLGVLALYAGVEPSGGDPNNLLPQLAATHLATPLIVVFFVMIIGSLSSTADSDLAALSSIVMTDIYGVSARRRGLPVNPKTMLLVGRTTMIVATVAAVSFAALRLNILDLLVFVGALWGCLVFPVIASFYWSKVTNQAFTVSVLAALAAFLPVRFGWLPESGAVDLVVELLGVVGIAVVLGLMLFGFFGPKVGMITGSVGALALAPFAVGLIADYEALSGSLVAYAVSTLVCAGMTFASRQEDFDFDVIARATDDFDPEDESPSASPADDSDEPVRA